MPLVIIGIVLFAFGVYFLLFAYWSYADGYRQSEDGQMVVMGIILCAAGGGLAAWAVLSPPPKAGPALTVESMPFWPHRDSWTAACRPLLGPGVVIRAICMFSTTTGNLGWCLVLTDAHLHLAGPDPTRGLQFLQTIPLGKLSSVVRTTWYYPKEWDGGTDFATGLPRPQVFFSRMYGFTITPATPLAYMSATVEGAGLMEFATPFRDGFEFADELAKRAGQTAAIAGAPASIARELEELARLKSEGILTDADWEQAKRMLLGAPPNKREEAERALRQLFALLQQGVLSESEFRTKKWEVLGKLG